jgi:two-component system response regulator YesN
MSKNTLYALFREHLGATVTEYITGLRIDRAKRLLRETKDTVYEVAESVGIDNYTYFCKLFKKREGISPSEYRKASDPV